jgi:hypothetical protein
MNKPVTMIIALSLLAVPISEVDATTYKHHGKRYPRAYSFQHAYHGQSDFYVHDSNKLRFGSNAWWRQMLRESRVRN